MRNPEPKVVKLTQRDIDSSSHRLSQTKTFTTKKTFDTEKGGSYAESFLKENPSYELDYREPNDKLKELNSQLTESGLEQSKRFTLLVQKKALLFILYGEASPEAVEALIDLGEFYNQNNRPQSAIRHLSRAHQLEQSAEVTETDSARIAVETADSHVRQYFASHNSKDQTKISEAPRHLQEANEAIGRVSQKEIEDARLKFRRDVIVARIRRLRGDNAAAISLYDTALASYRAMKPEGEDEELAELYTEMGRNCRSAGKAVDSEHQPGDLFRKSYNIYMSLNMKTEAEKIEPMLNQEEMKPKEESKVEEQKPKAEEQKPKAEELKPAEPPKDAEPKPVADVKPLEAPKLIEEPKPVEAPKTEKPAEEPKDPAKADAPKGDPQKKEGKGLDDDFTS